MFSRERTLIPASLGPTPEPIAVNPNRVEPLAEIVIALPSSPASTTGSPTPLRVSCLVTLTLS